MTPYYQDSHVTIYHGDNGDVMEHIRWDAVVTDPPYGINATHRPHGASDGEVVVWDAVVPFHILQQFGEVPVIWFGGAPNLVDTIRQFSPPPDRMLIWAPKFTLGLSAKGGIAYRYHPIYTWRLPTQKPAVHDVLTDSTECGNWWDHPATKPVDLMRRLVGLTAGTVLDPYMGSGTTLRAAKDLGRKSVGIELDERYCEVAARRMSQEVLQLDSTDTQPGLFDQIP